MPDSLLIKDITQEDIGIPIFVASSIELLTSDYGYYAKGYGHIRCSELIMIRAIAELFPQTRAGNIQGARDIQKKYNIKKTTKSKEEMDN